MKTNESNIDRTIRVVLGVILLVAGFGALNGFWAIIADIVGVILLVTAALGFCPLYFLLRISTVKK